MRCHLIATLYVLCQIVLVTVARVDCPDVASERLVTFSANAADPSDLLSEHCDHEMGTRVVIGAWTDATAATLYCINIPEDVVASVEFDSILNIGASYSTEAFSDGLPPQKWEFSHAGNEGRERWGNWPSVSDVAKKETLRDGHHSPSSLGGFYFQIPPMASPLNTTANPKHSSLFFIAEAPEDAPDEEDSSRRFKVTLMPVMDYRMDGGSGGSSLDQKSVGCYDVALRPGQSMFARVGCDGRFCGEAFSLSMDVGIRSNQSVVADLVLVALHTPSKYILDADISVNASIRTPRPRQSLPFFDLDIPASMTHRRRAPGGWFVIVTNTGESASELTIDYGMRLSNYPSFCKNDCSGRGKCTSSGCLCQRIWGGEDCSEGPFLNSCPSECVFGSCVDGYCVCDDGHCTALDQFTDKGVDVWVVVGVLLGVFSASTILVVVAGVRKRMRRRRRSEYVADDSDECEDGGYERVTGE